MKLLVEHSFLIKPKYLIKPKHLIVMGKCSIGISKMLLRNPLNVPSEPVKCSSGTNSMFLRNRLNVP